MVRCCFYNIWQINWVSVMYYQVLLKNMIVCSLNLKGLFFQWWYQDLWNQFPNLVSGIECWIGFIPDYLITKLNFIIFTGVWIYSAPIWKILKNNFFIMAKICSTFRLMLFFTILQPFVLRVHGLTWGIYQGLVTARKAAVIV